MSIENLWRSQIIVFKNDDYFQIFSIEIMNFKHGSLFQLKLIFGKLEEFQFALLPKCCTFKKSFMMKMQSIKEIWFIGELS
ncbi:DUF3916 domain-containing protein [Bacillus pacificus]